VNQAEKELYLREYAILKNKGKPFFPYAVAKDSMMAVIVMIVIIFLAAMLGAEMGPKADPTTTTYVPRPDWYFFFLFEVLRVMKNIPKFTDLATIGVPTICMILLFLLPFYDRSPERRIERRPIALAAGLTTIFAMAFLTYSGVADRGREGHVPVRCRCRGSIGLPGLPRDRRQRQQRSRAAADPHRVHPPPGGDCVHAAQPHGADALVRGPGQE
jgi:quinol-cytochrome oxidoreductase complex cytochrome b subunit